MTHIGLNIKDEDKREKYNWGTKYDEINVATYEVLVPDFVHL